MNREEYLKHIREYIIRIARKRRYLLKYLTERDYLQIAEDARQADLKVTSYDVKEILSKLK